jgi:hypothetical protein
MQMRHRETAKSFFSLIVFSGIEVFATVPDSSINSLHDPWFIFNL